MAKLIANGRELQKAFKRHSAAAEALEKQATCDHTGHMVLFYAVECGLKAWYLKQNRVLPNRAMPDALYSHDLFALIKELRVSAVAIARTFRRRSDGASRHSTDLAHTAWRYGVDLHEEDEAGLVAALNQLKARIEVEIG